MKAAQRRKKGAQKELATKRLYEAEGWMVTKAGGSLGVADLVCLKAGRTPRIVQVKCSDAPWSNFRPDERLKLRRVAEASGAIPELAWWGPRARTHILFEPEEWPDRLAA